MEEGLCIFKKADVVSRDRFNEMFGSGELTKGNPEVVRVI